MLAREAEEAAAAEGDAVRRRAADRAPAAGGAEAGVTWPRIQLRLNELAAHLERTLAPIYVVHGDEPLQAIEAGDAIRAAARRAGFDEREVLVAEPGFKWDAFLAANANSGSSATASSSTCASRRASRASKARKALEAYAAQPKPRQRDCSSRCRKLDRATQGSAWFAALAAPASTIAVLSARARRAARVDRRAARTPEAAGRAGDARLSRRPLRRQPARRAAGDRKARRCCCPKASSMHDAVEARDRRRRALRRLPAVRSVARRRRRARAAHHRGARSRRRGHPARCCGSSARTCTRSRPVQRGVATGRPLAIALRNARVWGKRQAAMERAARRVTAGDASAAHAALRAARCAVQGHRPRQCLGRARGTGADARGHPGAPPRRHVGVSAARTMGPGTMRARRG